MRVCGVCWRYQAVLAGRSPVRGVGPLTGWLIISDGREGVHVRLRLGAVQGPVERVGVLHVGELVLTDEVTIVFPALRLLPVAPALALLAGALALAFWALGNHVVF